MSEETRIKMSPAVLARLKARATAFGTLQEVADAADMPKPTVQKILSGVTDPAFGRVVRLAQVLGMTAADLYDDDLIPGGAVAEDKSTYRAEGAELDWLQVKVLDLSISAGNGSYVESEAVVGTFPFPRQWLPRNAGREADLRIAKVAGDSQYPELRDGDLMLFNLAQRSIREGMYVVRLDDALMVKRLQLDGGGMVRLSSANQIYQDIVVSLDQVELIGRVIWSGREVM